MTSRVSTEIRVRPPLRRALSPWSMAVSVPKIEQETLDENDKTLPVAAPINKLVRVNAANADTVLGDSVFARAVYDFIESGASVDLFLLPFEVDTTDDGNASRIARVVTSLGAFSDPAEVAKLPHRKLDLYVAPRETGLGSDSNPIVAKAKELYVPNGHVGAITICDAGPLTVRAGIDQLLDEDNPTQTDVSTWESNNSGPSIYSVSNRGNIGGYDNMYGSVIVAAHQAQYTTTQYGLGHNVFNLVDEIVGVSSLLPDRHFDPFDGSSEADVLSKPPHHLTSLIQYEGIYHAWGGTSQFAADDPRQYLFNNLLAQRIVKEAGRDMAPYIGQRATRSTLESMQVKVQRDLEIGYRNPRIPLVRDLEAQDPVITAGHTALQVNVQFYNPILSAALIVEVYA